MDTKVIIAIAAVAVVAIGGGIAAAVLLSNSGESLTVDTPKTTDQLAVDDYYSGSVDLSMSMDSSNADTSKSTFLQVLYICGGTKDTTSTKEVNYKESVIVCDIYNLTIGGSVYVFYNEPTSKVTYYYSVTKDGETSTYKLKDSNLDLSKTSATQTVVNGSYYKYDYSGPISEYNGILTGEYEYRITSYNAGSETGTLNKSMNGTLKSDSFKCTIKEFNSAGKVVTKERTETETKDDYLSTVSYDCLIKYAEEDGYTITHGDKKTDTIDTEFGKRKVTIETVKFVKGNKTMNYTLTYGEKGLIYNQYIVQTEDGNRMEGTFVLKETNLIVK